MAPEQARGEQEVKPTADIFSLGCVLYECLTGKPPFKAAHSVAVLARILCEEALPVRILRPEVPPAVEALLTRMLAKVPSQRPQDGEALSQELDQLGDLGLDKGSIGIAPYSVAGRWLPGTEQQLVCVMLATPIEENNQPAALQEERRRALGELVGTFAGRAEWLLDGSLVVTMAGLKLHGAIDLAYQAAQCALAITRHRGVGQLTLTMCRALAGTHIPIGVAIDQAVSLLAARSSSPSASARGEILLDRLSATLLARHFVVIPAQGIALLGEERTDLEGTQTAGRKLRPLLGRESELGALEAFWNSVIEESEPALVVVTGPSGAGKTRLWQELVNRLQASGEALTVLVGRGDSLHASTPYGLVEQALRGLLNGQEEITRLMLQARQGRETDHEQIQRQVLHFLQAEARKAPVLLVLDGMQWADALSVATIAQARKQLTGTPLLVLTLGSAEAHAASASPWPEHASHQLILKGLSKKACERLIQQLLGQQLAPAVLARIVELSGGNPLFLEVLIHMLENGKEERESEALIAMLQARIGGLPAAARRTLLTASLFGLTFRRGGLAMILAEEEASDLDSELRTLEEAELIERRNHPQFVAEIEYGFRHALIREAAYDLLSDRDRSLGDSFVSQFRQAI